MLELSLMLFFPFMMIYSAFSDLFTMTISNWVSILLIVGFGIFAYMTGMEYSVLIMHCLTFLIVFFAGFTLFAFNIIGGGDAKLAASTGLWLGWGIVVPYVLIASILGGALTLLIVFFRSKEILPFKLHQIGWLARLHDRKEGIPYGIALGLSALYIYPETAWIEAAL
ncbi:MAG: prepilin peptidase [Chloroflexota bacterium]